MERKKFLVAAVTLAAFALSTAACGSSTQGGGDVAIPDGGIDAGGDGGRPVSEVVWPVQPADWNPDAKKVPVSIHLTYQRDPATAMTTQWQTQAISKNALKPKLWAVKATEARGEGSSLEIPFALQYAWDGVGVPYTDPVGSKYVEWVTEAMELEPGTKYYYRVGTWESFDFATKTFTNPNLSPIYSFTTGVAAGDPASFTVVLAGDSRSGNEQIKANMERLRKMGADLWLFNGDMTNSGTQGEWDAWFDAMGPLMRETPLMPVQGNHEMFADLFFNQFSVPVMDGLPDDIKKYAWSFDYGVVHFVGLNSNNDAVIQDQVKWLESDLKAARENPKIKFIVAMFHHPAYSASPAHGSTKILQDVWSPIFDKYSVDLAYSGHDHDYERSFPVKANTKAAPGEGTTYLVAGAFYAPGYDNGKDWWTAISASGNIGNYVVMDVTATAMRATAYSGDGATVIDSFTITK